MSTNTDELIKYGNEKLQNYIEMKKPTNPIPSSVLSNAPHVRTIVESSKAFYSTIAPELAKNNDSEEKIRSAEENLKIAADYSEQAEVLLKKKTQLLKKMLEQTAQINRLRKTLVQQMQTGLFQT